MMSGPINNSVLRSLVEHLHAQGDGEDDDGVILRREAVNKNRTMCLSMVGQVYWRLFIPYRSWPYKLGRRTPSMEQCTRHV